MGLLAIDQCPARWLLNEKYIICLSYDMKGKKMKCVYLVQTESPLAQ